MDDVITKESVIGVLQSIFDPEIPVNIFDLGLIYALTIDDDGKALVKMTLTAPGCPVAGTFPYQVEAAIKSAQGVTDAKVELVFEPGWEKEMISEAGRAQLDWLF